MSDLEPLRHRRLPRPLLLALFDAVDKTLSRCPLEVVTVYAKLANLENLREAECPAQSASFHATAATIAQPALTKTISPNVHAAANALAASRNTAVTGTGNRYKNPAAVLLGREGGRKGGAARAKALGPVKLSEAASKAARARWGKRAGAVGPRTGSDCARGGAE